MHYDLMENKTFIPMFEQFLKEGTKLTVWFPNQVTVGQADALIEEAEELFGVTAEVIDDPQSFGKSLLLPYLTERETREDDGALGVDEVGGAAVQQEGVVQPARFDRSAAGGLDARPREGEPVGGDAEVPEQRQVVVEAVVGVAGDRAVRAVGDRAGHRAEGVPDGRPAAVHGDGPLDLVRRSGHAEAQRIHARTLRRVERRVDNAVVATFGSAGLRCSVPIA